MTSARRSRDRRQRVVDSDVGRLLMTAGPVVPVPDDLNERMTAPLPGVHMWVMTGAWRIMNPATAFDVGVAKYLDLENLLTIGGPGCWVCEQIWTPELNDTVCPGDPSVT